MTYVPGISGQTFGELATAASEPSKEIGGGFLGRIFSEVKETVGEVAGTGIQTIGEWAKANIAAKFTREPTVTSIAPQAGAAPETDDDPKQMALPMTVLAGGAALLGFALLMKR